MTKRIILMRHAKSDWDTPEDGDFARPLNKRGRESATRIGQWLARREYLPDLVLCSSARRTQETYERVAAEMGGDPQVEYLKVLYLSAPEAMLQEVNDVTDAATVMVVAHNPGSAILANALAEAAPAHPRFEDYPTAATTVFEFDSDDWAKVTTGMGQVVDFVIPRDLAATA